jgi:hypothetical protein
VASSVALERAIANMIRTATWESARPGRRANDKATFRGFVTDFIVPREGDALRAQAFLVEQNPGWVLPVHFHLENQYQVVAAGGGLLGVHPIKPGYVHFASRESGYGPITAGPEGLSYFTLRVQGDTGAWYLPESRQRMQRELKRRQAAGKPGSQVDESELRALEGLSTEVMIAADGTGLAAGIARLPPNYVATAPLCDCARDRFYVVLQGSMILDDEELSGLATVFASAEEQPQIRAGAEGLEVVVVQFPDDARVPRAPTAET